MSAARDEKTHTHVIRRLHLPTDMGLMDSPDAHGLTGISSVPDRKDTTKGTAVKETTFHRTRKRHMEVEVHVIADICRRLGDSEIWSSGIDDISDEEDLKDCELIARYSEIHLAEQNGCTGIT